MELSEETAQNGDIPVAGYRNFEKHKKAELEETLPP
jgi:hypothetical protein